MSLKHLNHELSLYLPRRQNLPAHKQPHYAMCYYRLYIFLGCGHCTPSSKPISFCATASSRTQRKSKTATTTDRPDSGISFANGGPHSVTDASLHSSPGPSALPAQPKVDTSNPIHPFENQDSPDSSSEKEPEDGRRKKCDQRQFHSRQTYRIERLCSTCTQQRSQLLAAVSTGNEVKFEEWRWRVKYLSHSPEESRYTEWGAVGEVMGSWVKDWKTKGDELINVLKENVSEEGRSEGAKDGGGRALRERIGIGRKSSGLGRIGPRKGVGSS